MNERTSKVNKTAQVAIRGRRIHNGTTHWFRTVLTLKKGTSFKKAGDQLQSHIFNDVAIVRKSGDTKYEDDVVLINDVEILPTG